MVSLNSVFRSAILVYAVYVAGQATPDTATLRPTDEAAMRPDFVAFRMRLQDIVVKRDVEGLLAIVHPDIKSSFGGDEGIENFKGFWRIEEPDSQLWRELGAALALGGSFDSPDVFTAPYTFSRWPDDIDVFENVAVIASNVRLRAAARPDAPVVATVSYAILRLHDEALQEDWSDEEWTAVRIKGQKAYVATRLIRSPIDYRAEFVYSGGRWQLTVFVAGD